MKFCHNVVSGRETTASMYCLNSYFSTAALSSRNHLCCSGEMAGCEVVNSAISNVNSVSDQRLQRTERDMKKKKLKVIQKKRMVQIWVGLFFRGGEGCFFHGFVFLFLSWNIRLRFVGPLSRMLSHLPLYDPQKMERTLVPQLLWFTFSSV